MKCKERLELIKRMSERRKSFRLQRAIICKVLINQHLWTTESETYQRFLVWPHNAGHSQKSDIREATQFNCDVGLIPENVETRSIAFLFSFNSHFPDQQYF
jgi:hypothetical protein